MVKRRIFVLLLSVAVIVISMTTSPTMTDPNINTSLTNKEFVYDLTAGYVDEICFKIIPGIEDQIDAYKGMQIDMIGQPIDPLDLLTVPILNQTNRRGFGHISFNCNKAPTSWTALRQAFAYALDKIAIQQQSWGGYSRSVDSPIPPSMGNWSLDNHPDFIENYYDPDRDTGRAILDAAGFIDTGVDGWREDPNGDDIDIYISYVNISSDVIKTTVSLAVSAFTDLDIKAHDNPVDPNTLLAQIDTGVFNVIYSETDILGINPLFLENLHSESADNIWHFSNSTYDDLIEVILSSNDENEVYEACWEAQGILWAEQPMCVAFQNIIFSAGRPWIWKGYVNTNGTGVFDDWSFLKVHLSEEEGSGEDYSLYKQGGCFKASMPEQMQSTNLLNSDTKYTRMPLDLVYDTLYRQHPYTDENCAWLATDWMVEEVDQGNLAATPRAEAGDKTKISFTLNPRTILWHDGEELTAEDVAYSYQLINESKSQTLLSAVKNVTHVETPDNKTVEIFCSTGGLFNFHKTTIPVFPKHIWEPIANPLTWANPTPVGSGPYKWKSRDPGVEVVLERNDNFIYNPRNYDITSETSTTTTSSTTMETTESTTTASTSSVNTFDSSGFGLIALAVSLSIAAIKATGRKHKKSNNK